MNSANHELFLYHTTDTPLLPKTLAYAKSITDYVHEINIQQIPPTELQWEELIQACQCPIMDLIDTDNPLYKSMYGNATNFDEQDWLKILHKNPSLVKYAIAVFGGKTTVIKQPGDILKLK